MRGVGKDVSSDPFAWNTCYCSKGPPPDEVVITPLSSVFYRAVGEGLWRYDGDAIYKKSCTFIQIFSSIQTKTVATFRIAPTSQRRHRKHKKDPANIFDCEQRNRNKNKFQYKLHRSKKMRDTEFGRQTKNRVQRQDQSIQRKQIRTRGYLQSGFHRPGTSPPTRRGVVLLLLSASHSNHVVPNTAINHAPTTRLARQPRIRQTTINIFLSMYEYSIGVQSVSIVGKPLTVHLLVGRLVSKHKHSDTSKEPKQTKIDLHLQTNEPHKQISSARATRMAIEEHSTHKTSPRPTTILLGAVTPHTKNGWGFGTQNSQTGTASHAARGE